MPIRDNYRFSLVGPILGIRDSPAPDHRKGPGKESAGRCGSNSGDDFHYVRIGQIIGRWMTMVHARWLAARAGIKVGDVLLSVGGRPVNPSSDPRE